MRIFFIYFLFPFFFIFCLTMKNQQEANQTMKQVPFFSPNKQSQSISKKNSNIQSQQGVISPDKNQIQQDVAADKEIEYIKQKTLNSLNIQCTGDKPGFIYCIQCQKNSIRCGDINCECQSFHKNCINSKFIHSFNQKLNSYVVRTSLQQQLSSIFDKMIDNISELRQSVQNQLSYFGLNNEVKNIFKKIQNISKTEVKGIQFKKFFNQQNKDYSNYWNDILNNFQNLIKINMRKEIKLYDKLLNKICQQTLKKNIEKFNFFNDSKILTKEMDKINMFSMIYEIKNVSKIQKVYTATDDGFNFQKQKFNSQKQGFFDKCKKKENLLYIVKNQNDKVYGGFSPCMLTYETKGKYIQDISQKTFIFSLDMNCKSKVLSKQFSIRHGFKVQDEHCLVSFGKPQSCSLVISQNSDKQQNKNWITGWGYSFQRNKHTKQQLYGTQDINKLKQIQVFQIHFKQKQQKKKEVK